MSKLNLGDSLILDTDYSTSEVKTGATWIDGKPIYRKVVQVPSLPNNTYTNFNHDIANVDKIWIASGSYIYASGAFFPAPFVSTSVSSQVSMYVTAGFVQISTATDRSSWSATLVLEYTKTTD